MLRGRFVASLNMEIDMITNEKGFRFTGKIDLTQWSLPKTESLLDDAFEKMQHNIEKEIEKQFEKLSAKVGNITDYARQAASESLTISLQQGLRGHFWRFDTDPEMLTIVFEDFCEDGFDCEIDIKKVIQQDILDRCERDGYLQKESEESAVAFAKMLRDCAEIVETAIRPKEDK